MESIRKWFYRPKKDDTSLLAQFFFADEALNVITSELDSFDGRKDPERCNTLVNQLRQSQDKVLTIVNAIMDVLIGDERANRDFRVKFPEDVLQENLAGQLWFGAECLAAGSSIMNREAESTAMRPLAKALTKSLENVRNLLRETCLRSNTYNAPLRLDGNELLNEMLVESLKIFDRLFADFELCYVSAMVPVKSTKEHELQQMISVLFSETLQQALRSKLLSQEMVDDCDPALMFAIPRLAIVNGLLMQPSALHIDASVEDMSEMFRPFRILLHKIRELLWTLTVRELHLLQRLLCDNEQIGDVSMENCEAQMGNLVDFVKQFCKAYPTPHELVNPKTPPETPSTSTYLIDIEKKEKGETTTAPNSLPDRDSFEIISVAAATLSSILAAPNAKKESADDSGISTETTSLDRSPSLDLFQDKTCGCVRNTQILQIPCKCQVVVTAGKKVFQGQDFSPGRGKKRGKEDEGDGGEGSGNSSDTSSFNSTYIDDEEVELALRAAEKTRRHQVRSKFRSMEDLIHRLFVCVAGVADQLQTNFASDLRNILKSVFLINTFDSSSNCIEPTSSSLTNSISDSASIEYHPAPGDVVTNDEFTVDPNILAQEALFDNNVYFQVDDGDDADVDNCLDDYPTRQVVEDLSEELSRRVCLDENMRNGVASHVSQLESPPVWIPDVEAPRCMACGATFTVVKRRHHCRNCGQVFCSRCSANSVPLPKFGHAKPVRVCNKCFMYHLMPFTM